MVVAAEKWIGLPLLGQKWAPMKAKAVVATYFTAGQASGFWRKGNRP
jgi:hypothetical protein